MAVTKKPRPLPKKGRAARALKKLDDRTSLALELACRGDLTLTQLRVAIYLAAVAEFEELQSIMADEIADELGSHTNHVFVALNVLAAKKIIKRTPQPHRKIRLVQREEP